MSVRPVVAYGSRSPPGSASPDTWRDSPPSRPVSVCGLNAASDSQVECSHPHTGSQTPKIAFLNHTAARQIPLLSRQPGEHDGPVWALRGRIWGNTGTDVGAEHHRRHGSGRCSYTREDTRPNRSSWVHEVGMDFWWNWSRSGHVDE